MLLASRFFVGRISWTFSIFPKIVKRWCGDCIITLGIV